MDPHVQDPPGEPTAEDDAEELSGLRALFHKPRDSFDPDDSPSAGLAEATDSDPPDLTSASLAAGHGADDAGIDADRTAQPGLGDAGITRNIAAQPGARDTAMSKNTVMRTGSDGVDLSKRGNRADLRKRARPGSRPAANSALVARPLINPHLRSDPRLRGWITRTVAAAVVFLGFTLWLGWRVGVSLAAVYVAADVIYRTKTTAVVPASVRVTSAQRYTQRRLRILHPAGYLALNARKIPGTNSVIDHLVIGPSGIFSLDSERMDRRLPVRAIGGMLYHGKQSMEQRLDHAREEASQAAALIGAELGYRVRVRPGMVLYGPHIPWVIMRFKGVDVFDGGRVGTYFRRQSRATAEHHLDSRQIAMVYAAAQKALPELY